MSPARAVATTTGSAGRLADSAAEVAGRHRSLERFPDHARESPAVAEPLACLAGHLVLASMDQREEEPSIPEEGERAVHDAVDLLRRRLLRPDRGLELDAQALDAVEHDREVQLLLARKVAVQRALAHPARLDHVVHLDLMVVAPREDRFRRAQDPVAEARGGWAATTGARERGMGKRRRHLFTDRSVSKIRPSPTGSRWCVTGRPVKISPAARARPGCRARSPGRSPGRRCTPRSNPS